jgi:leucyl aminopeptidase
MRSARRVVLTLLALAALAASARTGEDEVWITIGRPAAEQALAAFGRSDLRGMFTVEQPGEVAVARVPERYLPFLSRSLHQARRACGGYMAHPSREAAYAEAARAAAEPAEPPPATLDYTIDNGPVVQALMAQQQELNIRTTIGTLSSYFTRHHNCATGAQSANWIRDLWTGYANGRSDVTVELFTHTGYTTLQPSVILTIAGTTLPSEIVVLGAHQDSIAGSNCSTSRSPGADDDASGVASLSEAIRVAMALGYRPQRTVKFMAYAAEEVGLRGSAQIAQQHLDQGANVVGVLQLDMTNFKGSSADIYIYTDNTNALQNAFVGGLVDTYLPGTPRGTSSCGYACSDHASWNSRQYPASFPFEAVFGQHNPTIHSANDTLAQSGGVATQALKFSKLAAAYMAEVAKGSFSTNLPPTALAGPDQRAQVRQLVTLDGSASSDPDSGPSPLAFTWTQIQGPPVALSGSSQAVATFRTRTMPATYVFRLRVSDGHSAATDQVTVRVRQR